MLVCKRYKTEKYIDTDEQGRDIFEEVDSDPDAIVIPGCCEDSELLLPVILGYKTSDLLDYDAPLIDKEPIWIATSAVEWTKWKSLSSVNSSEPAPDNYKQVSFCPCCGKKLPAVRRKANPPQPMNEGHDGYCNACGDRNMDCVCWPPIAAWEIVED